MTIEKLRSTTMDERWKSERRGRRLICVGVAALFLLGGCNKQPPANTASTPSQPAPSSAQPAPPPPPPASQSPAPPPAAAPEPATAAAAAPAPAPGPAPRPAAPPPPRVYTVPSGTRLAVTVSEQISAKKNNVGDTFRGTLAQPVRVNGVTVLRAGTPVVGTVVAAKGQGRFKGAGDLAIELTSVGPHSVTTTPYEKTQGGKGKRSAAMIGGGGGGGALIGGLAGGGKGALIGGLLGAGAGTAGAVFTGNKDVVIPAESTVSFTSTSPIRVQGKPSSAEAEQQ
jgi:hypothetical protein